VDKFPVCTQCGFTFGEYRSRGLLGCPHCYSAFGDALRADVAWLHQALALTAAEPDTADAESLARWREQLAEAVRAENYEEAARLNRLIQASGAARKPGLGFA
jgi:protein arginine kinase activator